MIEIVNDNNIKNILDFYMLTNNLKNARTDKNQTITEQLYGEMVLANAINSEYNIVSDEKFGTVLKKILINTIYKANSFDILNIISNKNNKNLGVYNLFKLCEYYNLEECQTKATDFAFNCSYLECVLKGFFEKLKKNNIKIDDDIDNIYWLAKNYGITFQLGKDDRKNYEIFRFYYLNRILTKKERTGWDDKHWNIDKTERETVASHIVGTIALALAISSELEINIDIDKVIKTLSFHELGKIKIGDYTPFDGITKEEKRQIERNAFINIIGNLTKGKEMLQMFDDFEDKITIENIFAYYCDKLEADIQAKVYYDLGLHHSLKNQENNVVMKSKKVQEMILNGAKNAFDIWYLYDKPIYQDNEVFTKTLKYVRDNKLK